MPVTPRARQSPAPTQPATALVPKGDQPLFIQLKDRLRIVQRTSRDHFGGIAEELHRSLAEAVLAAKRAAGSYSEERQKRAALLQGQLKQLEQLGILKLEYGGLTVLDLDGLRRLASA